MIFDEWAGNVPDDPRTHTDPVSVPAVTLDSLAVPTVIQTLCSWTSKGPKACFCEADHRFCMGAPIGLLRCMWHADSRDRVLGR